eukprot:1110011-Pyramimonas_sp.AAC.3
MRYSKLYLLPISCRAAGTHHFCYIGTADGQGTSPPKQVSAELPGIGKAQHPVHERLCPLCSPKTAARNAYKQVYE